MAGAGGTAAARQPYRGLGDALSSIVRSEGVGGLYRGARANMLKIAVASAVQLAVFDGVKARLLRPPPQQQQQRQAGRDGGAAAAAGAWLREHPGAATLLAAMAAGLAVTAVVQPVDVVTTRLWNQPGGAGVVVLQMQLLLRIRARAGGGGAPTAYSPLSPAPSVVNGVGTLYSGALDCAAKTIAAEGPLALYKGCTAHVLRAGPHTVLTLLLLDKMQRLLGLAPPQGPPQPAAAAAKGKSK